MPLRALGYVASAVTLAEHLPKAQVQMVHTVHTGERVNGTNLDHSLNQASRLAVMSSLVLGQTENVTHLTDPEQPLAVDEDTILEAIAALPTVLQEKLLSSSKNRGDVLAYMAAHIQMHDTTAKLTPLRAKDTAPIVPQRIISLGAQSERPFYQARMAYRASGEKIEGRVAETGQVFTRHVLPPYYMCREGEPHINELSLTSPLRQPLEWAYDPLYEKPQDNPSVRRDLDYLKGFLSVRESDSMRALLTLSDSLYRRIQGGQHA